MKPSERSANRFLYLQKLKEQRTANKELINRKNAWKEAQRRQQHIFTTEEKVQILYSLRRLAANLEMYCALLITEDVNWRSKYADKKGS